MKLQPGRPWPIRHYREKALETDVTCDGCSLEYTVFGVFGFCPDCRQHNSETILKRNLLLTGKQLALAITLSDLDFRRHMVEDALENCVSAFDGFAREACRVRSADSADPSRTGSLSFQNLPRAAARLQELFGVDLEAAVGAADWALAHGSFMKRHLLAHRSGVIDQQYCDATGETSALIGRRVVVEEEQVQRLVDVVEGIGSTLVRLLEAP